MRELGIFAGNQFAAKIRKTELQRFVGILQECMVQRIVGTFEGNGSHRRYTMGGESLHRPAVRRRFDLKGSIWLRAQHSKIWTGRSEVANRECAAAPNAI